MGDSGILGTRNGTSLEAVTNNEEREERSSGFCRGAYEVIKDCASSFKSISMVSATSSSSSSSSASAVSENFPPTAYSGGAWYGEASVSSLFDRNWDR